MSNISTMMAAAQQKLREMVGEDVEFNGQTYRCLTSSVSGAKAGEQAVPVGTYGVFIASSTPRLFDFNPADFASIPFPQEGSILKRNGLHYIVTATDFTNEDVETVSLKCYALRFIWETPPV